jgi:transposase
MIPVPTGIRIWIATGHTDMRRGMRGLALQVQEGLGRDPFLCVERDYVAARSRHGQLRGHDQFCRHIIFDQPPRGSGFP